ncbi:MAG: hypothetical protein ACYC4L_17030 [Chloroflexota bacterium]
MKERIASLLLLAALATTLAAGCSPESGRVRGGGAGADIGNRQLGPPMEIHGPIDPYYKTPIDSEAVKQEASAAAQEKK